MNKRITAWSVVFIGLILFLTGLIFAQNSSDSVDWIPVPEAITAYIRERNYQDYLAEYPDAVKPNAEIVIPLFGILIPIWIWKLYPVWMVTPKP